jgi:hypothetical protein
MTENAHPVLPSELTGPDLLRLARKDRRLAREKLRTLDAESQAQACLELRPEVRSEFLMLLDHPERVAPLLPEAEICITIRAGGISEAAWLLDLATTDQLRACFDLDCWQKSELDLKRVVEWVEALIEAGRPALIRAIQETDLELWVLALHSLSEVAVLGKEDTPPDGWFTMDGVVYFGPREGTEFAHTREIAAATFERAQGHYWQLVYAQLFESQAECEEYALRWRTARLNDLGFPEREQAMGVYRPLRAEEVDVWEAADEAKALVPSVDLPKRLRGTLLGRALLELPPTRASDVLAYILSVVNAIAVADLLPLSDAESIPSALDKAVRGIEAGIREVARVQGLAPHAALELTRPLDLFRIGATLDRALRQR